MTEVHSEKQSFFGRISMDGAIVLKGLDEVSLDDPERSQENIPQDEEEDFSFDNQASSPTLELKHGGKYFGCW